MGAGGAIAAILLEGASSPHYFAPATAMIVAIVVECCRYVHAARMRIAPLLLAGMALVLALRVTAEKLGAPYTQRLNFQSWCCRVEGNLSKTRIASTLENLPGRHLVFVEAKTDPSNLFQWIYNSADIDGQRIVWARDLGSEKNAELSAYFAGRQVWMVNPNVEPAQLAPYPQVDLRAAASH